MVRLDHTIRSNEQPAGERTFGANEPGEPPQMACVSTVWLVIAE